MCTGRTRTIFWNMKDPTLALCTALRVLLKTCFALLYCQPPRPFCGIYRFW
jgi:hypothetical protein